MAIAQEIRAGGGPATLGPTFVGPYPHMAPQATIGELLRRERRSRHLSLEQLAERTKIDKTSLSDYENDKVTPDHATLIKVIRGLRTSSEPILAALGYPLAKAGDAMALAEAAIVTQSGLTDEYRQAALLVVRQILVGKTFTEDEVNEIVERRLNEDRKRRPVQLTGTSS